MFKKHLFLLTSIFLFLLTFFSTEIGLDPDFGWHLRMGELIAKSGIPATDPFSYSMPLYPFVDHEWLTNVGIAKLYPLLGLDGLAFLATIISFLAYFLMAKTSHKHYVILPFLFSVMTLFPYLGIRPQVQSWLFVASLLVLFLHEKLWQRFRFFVPLLLLWWVNVHGSFALGILLCLLVVGIKQVQTKRFLKVDWFIVGLAILATFINPYFTRSWWEVGMQISDGSLRWSIQEWMPSLFFLNVGFVFFLPFSLAFVIRYRKKYRFIELVLYSVLLVFGLSSARHLPFWLLIAIPITAKGIGLFMVEIKKIPFAARRLKIAVIALLVAFFAIFTLDTGLHIDLTGSRYAMYPDQAIAYLKKHPSEGQLFNHYNWGGYLIWKYPEKKVFVDGRMPSWREPAAAPGSSKNAFKEYQTILNGEVNPQAFFDKYGIDTVIIGVDNSRSVPLWLQQKIENTLGVKFPNQPAFIKQLTKVGMKEVYKDEVAVIYRKVR